MNLNRIYEFRNYLLYTFLFWGAREGLNEAVSTLIELGADPNVRSVDDIPLHCAAWNGHESVVETLLRNGADPNALGYGLATPLMHAVAKGRSGCAKLLLDHGADPRLIDSHENTALHYSIQQGHESSVALLAPLSPGFTTRTGMTALEYARSVEPVNANIVSLLRELELAGLDELKEAVGSALLGDQVPEVVQEVAEFLFSREVCARP